MTQISKLVALKRVALDEAQFYTNILVIQCHRLKAQSQCLYARGNRLADKLLYKCNCPTIERLRCDCNGRVCSGIA